MDSLEELTDALEALIFAAGEPMTFAALRRVFDRYWAGEDEAAREAGTKQLRAALQALEARWAGPLAVGGFTLVAVADGWAFRTQPRYAPLLRALHEDKPQRLSRAALETLAIVAYRQPVTKPQVDHIRGVDSSGSLKLLLERNQVRIVGKTEEPGRPMLYGTTNEFLSHFNLPSLSHLPSLRDLHELTEESQEQLRAFDGLAGLHELSHSAKQLRLVEEPAVAVLEEAVQRLREQEQQARAAFAAEGIMLTDGEPGAAGHHAPPPGSNEVALVTDVDPSPAAC